MSKNDKSWNFGEWSELYVLGIILSDGGMYAADENQNINKNIFYKVLKIIVEGNLDNDDISYVTEGNSIKIIIGDVFKENINTGKIRKVSHKMYRDMASRTTGGTFTIKSGSDLKNLLRCKEIRSPSNRKKDLDLVLLDYKNKIPTPQLGFSIKSKMGGPSTLINAGATKFIYEIKHNKETPTSLPDLSNYISKKVKKGKVKYSVQIKKLIIKLYEDGYELRFVKTDNEIYSRNLGLIDSSLSNYLSKILLTYYLESPMKKVIDLLDYCYPKSNEKNTQPRYKIRNYLSTSAMGLMPGSLWSGKITDFGGMIIVKNDGKVLCYYLYNLEDFEDYLTSSTYLDTPSTSRHCFGIPYKSNGKYFIKLNLQVRFVK